MGSREGGSINGMEAGVVLGVRVGSVRSAIRSVATGMCGTGAVEGGAAMGIAWAIAASGGIPPRCEPEGGGPEGARGAEPVRGYQIPMGGLYIYQ